MDDYTIEVLPFLGALIGVLVLLTLFPQISLLKHEDNQGKGAAVRTGLLAAYERGFTHALQVDADGQHSQQG